ncbi:MAG: hypothetical protein MZV70_29495 [Desulfobacterales bacterium]|nr:hypothetical protein [Desulfobacterales bacterium]
MAASNSVVYVLSARGGSILSWESRPVPRRLRDRSRPVPSSWSPRPRRPDRGPGPRGRGSVSANTRLPGPLVAGAVWSPPYVVLFVEDAGHRAPAHGLPAGPAEALACRGQARPRLELS